MQLINFRPPRIGMLFALLATVLHLLFPTPEECSFSSPVIGVTLGAAGFTAMMWSWVLFRKGDVAICPTARTTRLITGGVYRISRNPMYLGMASMLSGLAFYIGTPPFYLAAIGYFIVLNYVFCPYEEAKLLAAFKEEYANYRARVRRWL
ncbi:MAG TPA: isoprenylcysteine carboxylmethyltransferase family protein [Geobacteraceae bacterium]|nr:isoprenylcysteine carboxylmethyltransferase family protein [Geobacteraceae bacterium]